MQEVRKAVIYVRTLQPRPHDLSIEDQEAACRAACAENKWEVVSVFSDTERPQTAEGWLGRGEAIRETIHLGGILVVYDLARLVRTASDGIDTLKKLATRYADLHVVAGEISPQTTHPDWQKTVGLIRALWRVQRELSGSLLSTTTAEDSPGNFKPFGTVSEAEMKELEWVVWRKTHGFTAGALSAELKFRGIRHRRRSGSDVWWSRGAIWNVQNRICESDWKDKLAEWRSKPPAKQPGFDRFDTYVNRMIPELYMGNKVHPKDGSFVVPTAVVNKILTPEGKLKVDLYKAASLISMATPPDVPEIWRRAVDEALKNKARITADAVVETNP